MKKLSAILSLVLVSAFMMTLFSGCDKKKEKIVIYTSSEDYRIEDMQKRLDDEFPKYEISIEYLSTGDHAARLLSEGKETECDITFDLEYSNMAKVADKGILADLSDYDHSIYVDELNVSKYYIPELRSSGAIIVNTDVLKEKGLDEPKNFQDLLKSEYKDLISMPNPKSSGTGYMFLKMLVNTWGEDEAFAYFDKLSANISQFTASGEGPVNALIQGEAAIGLGMTAQAVTEINNGSPLKILFFEEGAPFSTYGLSIISGKETRKPVKEVFDFLYNTYCYENCEKFFPEQIYKDKPFTVKNYPTDIKYGDMKNNTGTEKERLLQKWKY